MGVDYRRWGDWPVSLTDYSGCAQIVVSLWKVPDDSTTLLMTEFYKNLRTTNDKAQALRQAMLTTKAKYADPLHWAVFTSIGEAE